MATDPRGPDRSLREKLSLEGLAPRELVGKMAPGAVFWVNAGPIVFPEARLPSAGAPAVRTERPAIIIQAASLCQAKSPLSVLVVPCSTAIRGHVGIADYEVPLDEPVFNQRTVALASLLQPLLKSDLRRFQGRLGTEAFGSLLAVVKRNLGMAGAADLGPPRP